MPARVASAAKVATCPASAPESGVLVSPEKIRQGVNA